MIRLHNHVAAAFAAIAITFVAMQVVTSVPPTQVAVIDTPAIA